MNAPQSSSAPETSSRPTGRGAGASQSTRILWFALALFAFIGLTVLASQPRFGASKWWLRPIEFNRVARANHIERGVDFTCISTLGQNIWIGGNKGVLIHSGDGGRTWTQLPRVMAEPAAPPALRSPPPRASGASTARSARSAIQRIAFQEAPSKSKMPDLPYESKEDVPNAANQAAPTKQEPQVQEKIAPPQSAEPEPKAEPRPLFSNDLIDLQFVNADSAYAVTARGEVHSSRDGGQTWRLVLPYDSLGGMARRAHFPEREGGVVVGEFGISSTRDGGETWSAPSNSAAATWDVALTSDFNGAAVGDFPAIEPIEGSGALHAGSFLPVAGLPKSTRGFTRIRKLPNRPSFACAEGGRARPRPSRRAMAGGPDRGDRRSLGFLFSRRSNRLRGRRGRHGHRHPRRRRLLGTGK